MFVLIVLVVCGHGVTNKCYVYWYVYNLNRTRIIECEQTRMKSRDESLLS